MQKVQVRKIYRVIDANFNRAKEALRVCEDVCRFFLNKKKLTAEFKSQRHQLTGIVRKLRIQEIIDARDISRDVGKGTIAPELKRKDCSDIFYANSQRAKESVRVLEEFAKLIDGSLALNLKKIRYKIYALEQEIVKKL